MIMNIGTATGIAPVVICDACGRRIESYKDGGVASAMVAEGELTPVMHFHRGACFRRIEPRLGGFFGDAPLSDHFVQLVHNIWLPPMAGAPPTVDEHLRTWADCAADDSTPGA